MEIVWSNTKVSILIELYQQHNILWDASNKYYKDKSKKNYAWGDIAAELNMSQKEVETKMHILRSQFSREKKKLKSSKRTGSGAEEVIKSRWLWYDPLQFLSRGATTSGTSDTMGTDGSTSTQPSNTLLSEPPLPPPPLPSPPILQSNNSKKRKCDDNLKISDAYEIMKSAKKKMEESNSKDEFEIYSQYVASELRNVKNERTLLQAKYYINNILLQARMGYFDHNYLGGYRGYGDGWHGHGDRYCTTSSTSTYVDASTPTQTPEPQVHTVTGDELHFSNIDEIVFQLQDDTE